MKMEEHNNYERYIKRLTVLLSLLNSVTYLNIGYFPKLYCRCQRPTVHRHTRFLVRGCTSNNVLCIISSAQDCSRIDRFINRTVNLGYIPADCHTFNALVNTAEDRLLSSVIRNSYHVLRPLLPLSSPDGLSSASELIHLP